MMSRFSITFPRRFSQAPAPTPKMGEEERRKMVKEFVHHARLELERGDLLQASEKGWGAAAQAVKAAAESRGWPHASHGDLYRIVGKVAEKSSDNNVRTLFHAANCLHKNFYEGAMKAEDVKRGLDDVKTFVALLKRLGY